MIAALRRAVCALLFFTVAAFAQDDSTTTAPVTSIQIPVPQAAPDTTQFANGIDINGMLLFGVPGSGGGGSSIPLPQTTPFSYFVTGIDSLGTLTSSQVDFSNLSFTGLLFAKTTSTSSASIAKGSNTFTLDDATGFARDYWVKMTSVDDPTQFMFGVITNFTTDPGPATITVSTTIAPGGGTYQNWIVEVNGGPVFGLSASVWSGIIPATLSIPTPGDVVSTTTDIGKAYSPGDIVGVAAVDDATQFFTGEVVSYNSTTGAISLFVKKIGGTGSWTAFTITLIDTSGVTVNVASYSGTSLQFGSSHDIFVGATVSVTTGTNKLFKNSHIILNSTTDSTQYFRGISQAYNASTGALTIFVTDVGPTATGTIAAWSLFAQDGPAVNAYQIATSATPQTLSILTTQYTFTTQAGRGFVSGGMVTIYSGSNAALTLYGQVDGYSGTTLVVNNFNVFAPTGSASDWIIVQSTGQLGASGALTHSLFANFRSGGLSINNQAGTGFPLYVENISPATNTTSNQPLNLKVDDQAGLVPVTPRLYFISNGAGIDSGSLFTGVVNLTNLGATARTITVTADTTLNGTPGTVSTTGSPASGNLTKFSAATTITNGDLTGDVTTSGTLATTIAAGAVIGSKIASSVALAGSPTTTTQSANDNSTKIATTAYFDKCHATVASGSLPAAANQDVAIPAGCSNIMVTLTGAKCNATCAVEIQFSINSGSTYDTTVANYDGLQLTGAAISATTLASILEQTTATSAQTMSGSAIVFGYGLAGYKNYQSKTLVNGNTRGSQGAYLSTSAITNVRIVASSGSFTAGSYVVSLDYLLFLFAFKRRRPANENAARLSAA